MTIPNFQNVTLGNTKSGVVQLRPVTKSVVQTSTSDVKTISGPVKKLIPQNKGIVTKFILGGQQGPVVLSSQANETAQPQQIKLVTSSLATNTLGTTAKTITLAQAQQMGLLTSSKVQQIVPQSTKAATINKTIQGKTIKVVPNVKSPTKILPAPAQKVQTVKGAQRVIIRQGTQIKGGTIVGSGMNQVIRIPASQTINPGQIHQVNIPGKGVQYIRFMTATTAPSNSTATTTVTTVKTVTPTTSTTQKAQVVPVASIAVNRQTTSKTTVVPTTGTSNIIKVKKFLFGRNSEKYSRKVNAKNSCFL